MAFEIWDTLKHCWKNIELKRFPYTVRCGEEPSLRGSCHGLDAGASITTTTVGAYGGHILYYQELSMDHFMKDHLGNFHALLDIKGSIRM